MWHYILITLSGDKFYYDMYELEEARQDKAKYGGTLKDRNGTVY